MPNNEAGGGVAKILPADWKDHYYTKDGIRDLYPLLIAGCKTLKQAAERIGCAEWQVQRIEEIAGLSTADGVYKWDDEQKRFLLVVYYGGQDWYDRETVHPYVALTCAALEAVDGSPLESLEPGMVQRLEAKNKGFEELLVDASSALDHILEDGTTKPGCLCLFLGEQEYAGVCLSCRIRIALGKQSPGTVPEKEEGE